MAAFGAGGQRRPRAKKLGVGVSRPKKNTVASLLATSRGGEESSQVRRSPPTALIALTGLTRSLAHTAHSLTLLTLLTLLSASFTRSAHSVRLNG